MHFFHLEFRNPIPQEAANTICALEHHYIVSGTCELLCDSKTSRPTTDDCNTLTCLDGWDLRNNPPFTEGMINDLNFDLLNCYGVLVHTKNTCRFARSWAQTASEFWKVIRCVQALDCLLPMTAIHEVVPVRNQVAQWTAVIAERNTAVHATPCLMVQLASIKRLVDLFPVFKSQCDWASCWATTTPLKKSGCLTHVKPPLLDLLFLLRQGLLLLQSPSPRELSCSREALPCGTLPLQLSTHSERALPLQNL